MTVKAIRPRLSRLSRSRFSCAVPRTPPPPPCSVAGPPPALAAAAAGTAATAGDAAADAAPKSPASAWAPVPATAGNGSAAAAAAAGTGPAGGDADTKSIAISLRGNRTRFRPGHRNASDGYPRTTCFFSNSAFFSCACAPSASRCPRSRSLTTLNFADGRTSNAPV